jgi:hypothetical protein
VNKGNLSIIGKHILTIPSTGKGGEEMSDEGYLDWAKRVGSDILVGVAVTVIAGLIVGAALGGSDGANSNGGT